jgi:hypothetical protein
MTSEVGTRNGARGTRDIEGKVTRVGASEPGGERVSITKQKVRRQMSEVSGLRWIRPSRQSNVKRPMLANGADGSRAT